MLPGIVSDEEWVFVAPLLSLLLEDVSQRVYPLCEVFNGMRYILKTGTPWRWMPNDLPPWTSCISKRRGVRGDVHDLRVLLRICEGKEALPTAASFDSRILQSSPESGERTGYDGAKRRKGSKVHLAVDMLGNLLRSYITPTNAQDRAQVSELAAQIQQATGDHIQVAFVDAGDTTGQQAAAAGIALQVIKPDQAKRGFVLLPRRWVVERSFRLDQPFQASGATTNVCRRLWTAFTSPLLPCSCYNNGCAYLYR